MSVAIIWGVNQDWKTALTLALCICFSNKSLKTTKIFRTFVLVSAGIAELCEKSALEQPMGRE